MVQSVSIGSSAPRIEGPEKVTGASRFAADIILPGILWGKVLRSPFPHAKIVKIDTSRAKNLPGVHAVITGREFPLYIGRWKRDLPVLAIDKVRFIGERVAAVAADTREIAEEALWLIDVEYDELPAMFDQMEAIKEGAPLVHEDPHGYDGSYNNPEAPVLPNLCAFSRTRHRDVIAGFGEADHIFENTFTTAGIHQGYIEPHACVAWVHSDGKVDVWASNKCPWPLRDQLSKCIVVPPEMICINPVSIGGDFGGKGSPMDTPVAYLLSKMSGRPVKIIMDYAEELLAANPRHPSVIKLKTGVKKDGRICAMEVKAYLNSGAYGAFKPSNKVDLHGIHQASSCYNIPNLNIESFMIYTNTVPRGHMRSPGAPQTTFAVETQFDIIAKALRIDPAEFRMLNLVDDTTAKDVGRSWHHVRAKATLQKALEAADWGSPKEQWEGRGIAMYERMPGAYGESNVKIVLDRDGHVTVYTGVHDPGQGAFTVFQQIAADVLKIPANNVRINPTPTEALPLESGVGGSRTTYVAGQAVFKAAEEVRNKVIEIVEGRQHKTTDSEAVSNPNMQLSDMLEQAVEINGGAIEAQVSYQPETPDVTSFTAQIAEVKVDHETGQVKVKRIVTAHDVGTVINPIGHQGQIEGGAIQGLGYALMEELAIDEGKPVALHMGDYKIPSMKDIPELVTVLLEERYGAGHYNVRSIGESSNVPTAGAIANAVSDAIGAPIFNLPITSEKVWKALRSENQVAL